MSIERTNENAMTNSAKNRIGELAFLLEKYNNNIASGQKLHVASDSPLAIGRVINYRAEATKIEQYTENTHLADAISTSVNESIQQFNKVFTRVHEIAMLTSSEMNVHSYTSYTTELNELLEQALSAVEKKFGQDYLFGGTLTNTPPFTASRDSNEKIIGFTYAGNSSSMKFRISSNIEIAPYSDATTNNDLLSSFNAMVALRDALELKDSQAIRNILENDLVPLANKVAEGMARNGAILNFVACALELNQFDFRKIEEKISDESSTDLAKTMVSFQQTHFAYDAASTIYSRILSDFGMLRVFQ